MLSNLLRNQLLNPPLSLFLLASILDLVRTLKLCAEDSMVLMLAAWIIEMQDWNRRHLLLMIVALVRRLLMLLMDDDDDD
jgi:hypothetical protein